MIKLKISMKCISGKIEEIYRKTCQKWQYSKTEDIKIIAKLIYKGSRNMIR